MNEPLPEETVHLCIDMQRLFGPGRPWATPWMERVLPRVADLVAARPAQTVFTRFIPPMAPDDMPGMWRRYYEKWHRVTRGEIDPHWLDLMEPLSRYAPPATTIDKTRYSAFAGSPLHAFLQRHSISCLVVTGSETDVCVLATVLSAVDFGYRTVLVTDAVCSSSDEGHDALLQVYHRRFSLQIEIATAEEVLDQWRSRPRRIIGAV
ncbi:cysteine hydrolase family protein [Rhodoplanes sp. Z2-YC6860]|uniref:cysteine hydrolase family protein n=1 Tax=Rhodoplanes sp. Z2-YC6860 TaxID=674703 RepID=UPI00078DF9B8|nr:isochorismatase family cysteine hydrolase [Rhodoplanes sp. Z2-YC6860]AMN44197.1 nicotinamidase-like amidase [Rhodoplanes sp. Z2-YC6860]